MDPNQPSQPALNTVYDQPSNPAQSISEYKSSTTTSASQQRSAPTCETRRDNDKERDAVPSALAYGERNARNDADERMGGPVSNLEGEQMRPAGEGEVAKTQETKHGFGEQEDLASGLDRKKAEQDRVKDMRRQAGGGGGVDVGAVLGGGSGAFVGAENDKGSEYGAGGQNDHTHV
ncbi:MAG: hypothetical protein Q9217_003302 [Psora testacea]